MVYTTDLKSVPFTRLRVRVPPGAPNTHKVYIMRQSFVIFCCPGTFMTETTQEFIFEWDVEVAKEMARNIKARHNATPYGFYFCTRERKDDELDSSIVATSPMYYLGGKVETLAEVEERNKPSEEILRWNMRTNGYNRIITNTNSYRSTLPLKDNDIVLQWP